MIHRRLTAALATLALAATALAQDAIDLKAALTPGDGAEWTFKQDLGLRAEMGAVDQVNIEALSYTQLFSTHVLEVRDDGTATVELVFDRITADYRREDPGHSIKDAYDSDTPDKTNAGHLKRAIDPVVGATLRLRVRPSGEVFYVQGLEGRAPTMDPVAATIFDRLFDTKAVERGLGAMFRLKQDVSQEWPADTQLQPSQAREGETWLTERREASRAGEMWTHFTHTLDKIENGRAHVSTDGKVIIQNAGLTPVSPEISVNEVDGAAVWDLDTGSLVERSLDWRVEITMGGDDMPITARVTDESHLRRTDLDQRRPD